MCDLISLSQKREMLPRDVLREITLYLPYADLLSLTLVCKDFSFLREEDYYANRLKLESISPYLTYRGEYVLHITSQGDIVKGSENFIPLTECIEKAYWKQDNSLLTYFLEVNKGCPYLTPLLENRGTPQVTILLQNILVSSALKSREESFLLVLSYLKTVRDVIPLYIIAKRNGMDSSRRALASLFSQAEREEIPKWIPYCIVFKDEVMFRDLYPHIKEGKEDLPTLLKVYPWPEVADICPAKATTKPTWFVKSKIEIPFIDEYIYEYFPDNRDKLSGLLAIGNRENVRKYLMKGVSKEDAIDIRNSFSCEGICTKYIYETYFKFTISSLVKDKIDIPSYGEEIYEEESCPYFEDLLNLL